MLGRQGRLTVASLPDPIRLLGVTVKDINALIAKDGNQVALLLLAATGHGRAYGKPDVQQAARDALYAWAYTYLEPRFDQYQSWATELAAENYSTARLEAVGPGGFTPTIFDRGAGVESFVGWMLSSFRPESAKQMTKDARSPASRRPAGVPQGSQSGFGSYHLGKLRFSHVAGMSTEDVALWMQDAMNQGAQLRTMGAYNDTMTGNSLRDPLSVGWIRVAEPGACAFCLMLASRGSYGILYRSEQTANFRAHSPGKNGGGLCRCHALAAWDVAGKVKQLGEMPNYAESSPYAPYAASAAVFLDTAGARGLIAA
jgi:hypothetical protein